MAAVLPKHKHRPSPSTSDTRAVADTYGTRQLVIRRVKRPGTPDQAVRAPCPRRLRLWNDSFDLLCNNRQGRGTVARDNVRLSATRALEALLCRDPWKTGWLGMWAQFISGRLKAENEADLPTLIERLHAVQRPGSGHVRSAAMRDDNDLRRVFLLVIFESQEKASALENDPQQQEAVRALREAMSEIFDGRPEYAGLTIVDEWAG
jgi:hypothetical protein